MDPALAVLTPRGIPDPALAIAASRAGGVGLLDLSGIREADDWRGAMRRLHQLGRPPRCGVKLDAREPEIVAEVATLLPADFGHVLLAPGGRSELAAAVEALRKPGRTLLLEAIDPVEATEAGELGFDAVVAKGNEAGGRVGERTTFVLLQGLLEVGALPVWAQGGIGLSTIGACFAAGAAGAVLDAQTWLTRESPLRDECHTALARMDGTDTAVVGGEAGEGWRLYERPGHGAVASLRELVDRLATPAGPEAAGRWRVAVRDRVALGNPQELAWPLGQDGALAAPLADRFRTVAGVLSALRDAARDDIRTAARLRPLAEGAPLARSHGTRYPIVQGPMTRVSDHPAFADGVAAGGALPLIALALMGATRSRSVPRINPRAARRAAVGSRHPRVRARGSARSSSTVIRDSRPPFALIAGGRPDQALELERDGIPTYLHVPSPGCCACSSGRAPGGSCSRDGSAAGTSGRDRASCSGARMVDVLLDELRAAGGARAVHVVFAGGIHDARSAAMVADHGRAAGGAWSRGSAS